MAGAWKGKSRFLAAYGKEAAEEQVRWDDQAAKAAKAREIEKDRYNLWSIIGTAVALPFLGPIAPLVGAVAGNVAKGVGTWDDGRAIEDIKMGTSDVGTWNRSQNLSTLENINREFEEYDTEEFWGGIMDIGKAGLFALKAGGGLDRGFPTAESLSNWSPTKWGGTEGSTSKDLWRSFLDRE